MQIVAGKYRSRKIESPKGEQTRPTSSQLREALFNICNPYIIDAHFLDLFSGSGAVGFEALSRGAGYVTFVEDHKECIQCIHKNIKHLEIPLESVKVIHGDVFNWLSKLHKKNQLFDIIFADPPYEIAKNNKTIPLSNQIVTLIDQMNLLSPQGNLFVEESKLAKPLADGLNKLQLINVRQMGKSTLSHYKNKDT